VLKSNQPRESNPTEKKIESYNRDQKKKKTGTTELPEMIALMDSWKIWAYNPWVSR
jgi:hypothetical protein